MSSSADVQAIAHSHSNTTEHNTAAMMSMRGEPDVLAGVPQESVVLSRSAVAM